MPDNKNLIQSVIEFLVDKTSLNKSKRAFDEIKRKNDELSDSSQKQKRGIRDLGDAFQRFGDRASNAVKNIGTEYKSLQRLDGGVASGLTKARYNP